MTFVEAIMTVGLCMLVGAAGFIIVHWVRTLRGLRLTDEQRGRYLDVYMSVVWGGMLLVQAGNIILHKDPSGTYHLTLLTLSSTGSEILVFGGFIGRLLLRRELRWLKERREAEGRA